MGRLSNLILVSPEGVILECARRVPARINRYRTVLPGQPYVPPPPQDKLAADELDSAALTRALDAQPGPLFRRLVQSVAGISPLLAREIVYRATGDQAAEWPLDDSSGQRLFGVLQRCCACLGHTRGSPRSALSGPAGRGCGRRAGTLCADAL